MILQSSDIKLKSGNDIKSKQSSDKDVPFCKSHLIWSYILKLFSFIEWQAVLLMIYF